MTPKYILGLTALVLIFAAGTMAQETGSEVPLPPPPPPLPGPTDLGGIDSVGPVFVPTPDAVANPAAAILSDARRFCGALKDRTYQIDCLAERMRAAAAALPADAAMAPARQALQQAATRLERTVSTYRDSAKPPVRARRGGANPVATARPLAPVRAPDLAVAQAEALSILEETETILLRSADQSAERALSYRQIAAAVDSNKVLLRS
ncbi:hypothetical protein [Actibacterium ureilyticum]|uniref:hypothetical protein n=1 Tax=Actibacterium ureilyticum TaxID=1590614 RepID=UPI000BAAD17E|nr:hypothetical protein [Actibacterium ureilyticum]